MPGLQPGGWMQRLKDEGQDILDPHFGQRAIQASSSLLLGLKIRISYLLSMYHCVRLHWQYLLQSRLLS